MALKISVIKVGLYFSSNIGHWQRCNLSPTLDIGQAVFISWVIYLDLHNSTLSKTRVTKYKNPKNEYVSFFFFFFFLANHLEMLCLHPIDKTTGLLYPGIFFSSFDLWLANNTSNVVCPWQEISNEWSSKQLLIFSLYTIRKCPKEGKEERIYQKIRSVWHRAINIGRLLITSDFDQI